MKIACISISRSDWNALGMVAMVLREQGADVAAHFTTGHEAPEMLEADGFAPVHDTPHDADLIVLCGDRYVTALAALQVARSGVPIAHIAGGDITEGSTDDSYRHAITKLAHLHFPTHEDAKHRIVQMGEEPWRVFNHGSASIDRIKAASLLSREETLAAVGISRNPENVVVLNWQPMGTNNQRGLLAALEVLDVLPNVAVVAVGANDDPGGDGVNELLRDYGSSRLSYHPTLPANLYLSLLRHAHLLIGNSSSAYYEAAALGCPAVDVGDRQKGRLAAQTVLHAEPAAESIAAAVEQSWRVRNMPGHNYPTPFGNGNAAHQIAKTILSFEGQRDRLIRKRFVDHEL